MARLARLKLSEEEKKIFSHQLNEILEYMEKLKTLNTENIEPTFHPLPLSNVWREDKVKKTLPQEEVLGNAPEKERGYFKVPRIIEG